ncbi:MAG TPA: hypothetical protein VI258_00875 [Rhodanobacteraceae bacterium]
MTVHCVGECRLLEQVGEKQDFECMLTARGLRHEQFSLRVRRRAHRAPGADWNCDYSVTVTRMESGVRHRYIGGPAHEWVMRCAADLARGAYVRRSDHVPLGRREPQGRGLPLERGTE